MASPDFLRRTFALTALSLVSAARADIMVSIDLSSTSPAAVIDMTSKNAIQMWPQITAEQKAQYIVLDDGTSPSKAVANIRKLIDEDHVDVIVGPNITPAPLATRAPAAASHTPMMTLAGLASVVEPQERTRVRAFQMAQADAAVANMMPRRL